MSYSTPSRQHHLNVPPTRADAHTGYTCHGRWFNDPYVWLEQLETQETQAWIAAQAMITHQLLDEIPERDQVRATVARATRYARVSPPIAAGPEGCAFFWQADAQDDKLKLMLRRTPDAPFETVLDPNTWADDEALVFAVPSPDGSLVAFGKAVGSTHGAQIQVLDVATKRLLADRPRGTSHASLAWRPDGSGFFYAALPAPGDVAPGDEAHWEAVYEHRIGSGEPARRVWGDNQAKDDWYVVQVSACGRFAVLYQWDYVHANKVCLLRLADNTLIPVAPEMQAINQVQVLDDVVLIATDRDAPRGRACIAPLAEPTAWHTIIPEQADTLQTITGIGGRLYAVYGHAASHRVRIYAKDGNYLRDMRLPALGAVNYNEGSGVVSGISGS